MSQEPENNEHENLNRKPNQGKRKFQFSAKGKSSKAMGLPEWGLGLMPVVFWGTAFYFVAEALDGGMNPGTIVWLRMTFAFVFFALIPIKIPKHKLDFHDKASITILGIVSLALPLTLFAIAQQWIASSLAGMLVGAQPIFATILASLFLKTAPSRKNVIGLCFGLGGLVATALPNVTDFDAEALGVVLVMIALVCYAFSYNFSIPLTQKYGSYFVNLRMLFVGSIVTAPYGIYGMFQTQHNLLPYIAVIILGIGATAITPHAANLLSARVGATRASSVNFLIPLVALYMGHFIRDETTHWLALVGLGLILIGIASMGGADTRHAQQ